MSAPGGFVPVRLVVRRKDAKTGAEKLEKVTDIRVPAFSPMPGVIIWGARVFTGPLPAVDEDAPDVYVETFAYWTQLTTGLVAQGA